MDNASGDGSPEIVEERVSQRDTDPVTQKLGFACANNVAIKRARGTVLTAVDSDSPESEHEVSGEMVCLRWLFTG